MLPKLVPVPPSPPTQDSTRRAQGQKYISCPCPREFVRLRNRSDTSSHWKGGRQLKFGWCSRCRFWWRWEGRCWVRSGVVNDWNEREIWKKGEVWEAYACISCVSCVDECFLHVVGYFFEALDCLLSSCVCADGIYCETIFKIFDRYWKLAIIVWQGDADIYNGSDHSFLMSNKKVLLSIHLSLRAVLNGIRDANR